jgi:hypothetical protein
MEVRMAYNVWETCMLVPGFSRSECAAWVQAWGSIVAIVGAFLLSYNQLRVTRAQAIEAEHRRLTRRHNAIVAVAMFAERVVRISCSAASMLCDSEGELIWQSEREDLEMAREELVTVRAAELESFSLVQGIRRLTVSVENALRVDEVLTAGLGGDRQAFHRVDSEARQASHHAGRALEEVVNAIRELKDDPDLVLPPFSFSMNQS